jgi:asparagine synthase (glutamine-hydrolysing)
MCGLAGLLEAPSASGQAVLAQLCASMTGTLRHRGPDDGGIWTDADAGIALGLRRLAIIDLSMEGHQQMVSASGRYVLTINGEIYNYRELRRDLEQRGVRFRGQSDTEVLLEGIDRWGLEDALRRANGMFALALWDRTTRLLHLARDRLGQKPLYYGWTRRGLAFASELKAIEANPHFQDTLDRSALALFLRHGYVPDPFCIWSNARKLPPGTMLTVSAQDIVRRMTGEPQRYWNLREIAAAARSAPVGSERDAADALDQLLRDAVRLCMVADVPIGAFLSGGIDSSTVVALMQAQSSRPVRTFSIGFHEDRLDEARHAMGVARHLGTDHTELYVSEADALAVIPSLSTVYDEPFADSSQLPTYLVSRLARESVTVSLSGDGGDEVFGGYNRYVWGAALDAGIRGVPRPLRSLAARTLQAIPVAALDSAARLLPERLRYAQAGDKLHKLARIIDAPSSAAAYRRVTSLWDEELVTGDGVQPEGADWPDLTFQDAMMLRDTETYLPGDILTKVDRASMAVSLEARVPLLDHRVVEFAWRLPLSMKLRKGSSKWLLRQVLDRYVPQKLIERPKAGFAVPLATWLRGPLRAWAEDLLAEDRLRADGYFAPAPIRRRWQEHLSGRRNWQDALWAVLMFQEWLQRPRAAAQVPVPALSA